MLPEGPAALVIGHPGHELLLHGWMELARPRVLVLTDGSGRTTRPRLDSTRRVLAKAGAQPGSLFGYFTDRSVYDAILHHDFEGFIALTEALARDLAHERIAYVVGDAAEGYSPTHDICRAVINAAAWLVGCDTGHHPINLDFTLIGRPDAGVANVSWTSIRLELNDAALQRKVQSAFDYPELAHEIHLALHDHRCGREGPPTQPLPFGILDLQHQTSALEAFRVECLRHVNRAELEDERGAGPPFYEVHGERQVAAGHYSEVIRYRQHVRPLLEAIQQHVGLGKR
jgi:AcrR family transcriptional regulator